MQTPPVGQPPREPTPPSGGGGVDRGGSPTERSLHGALAAAGTHGTMTDTPTAPPGLSAEERLLAALREAGAGGATAPSVGTPGFGLPGSSSETTHGAFSMPPPSSLFPPSTTTNADVSNVGLTAHSSFPNLGVGLTAHDIPNVGLTAHGGSLPQTPPSTLLSPGSEGYDPPTVRHSVLQWESRHRDGSRNKDKSKVTSRTIDKGRRSPSTRSSRGPIRMDSTSRPPQTIHTEVAEIRNAIETFTIQQASTIASDMAQLRRDLGASIAEINGKITEDRSILNNLQHQADVVQTN